MAKVILISQLPLPYPKIGSWTTLYQNYLNSDHAIDYIICEQSDEQFQNVEYGIVSQTLTLKLKKKYQKNNYIGYIEALEKIVVSGEKYIIQIVDNFGIIKPLQEFLESKGKRTQCYIQFFYHGFAPFYGNFESRSFYEFIDEMVLLTHDSYKAHKNYYTILPCRFSVLHNGIDENKFFKVSTEQKQKLREKLGLTSKTVFIWCSQDRPKKGLDLILDVWNRIYEKHTDCTLLVIGAKRDKTFAGVSFLGKIPNDELPQYYQAADAYLFPTLWHEGFGLSLIEALHCGCYSIASALGGVPEVLQYGNLGRLIENPHFIAEWVDAIDEFLLEKEEYPSLSEELYSKTAWNKGMNERIAEAKKSLGR
ncbi:glycosyltransferase family 4 protein [Flavobacterium lindanitolerans]|uniref:Glycosyl transferase family 1 n=1 Tax=Flavobacterium lindanitolerans TaxID=428988 RepID=A0A497TZD9_9FLAO|nr:glycosyltransferase family 4 protein [Flavobacterium lindanitolerans]PKW20272.1 glycosyl transferase family 1 [Flavobacterium lindanitolerans]RLJ23770.1 glycosyl transferase family 1 [Flavobacterium lindanitolerans]